MSLFVGDAREGLRGFVAAGVRAQCCVTSPPYWWLRDYGVVGQLGLEPTIGEYVANMVEVFRLVREVLADDGVLWLNLWDSYHNGDKGGYQSSRITAEDSLQRGNLASDFIGAPNRQPQAGLKPKDLCGIPWRVAFALQADGWWLRQDIIWAKPNPMPESVTDRCTKSHEYLFLLAKSERYFYDAAAIREPSKINEHGRHDMAAKGVRTGLAYIGQGLQDNSVKDRRPKAWDVDMGSNRTLVSGYARTVRSPAGWKTGKGSHGSIHEDGREQETTYAEIDASERNRRSVWTIATQPYAEAHFATFPTALVEPCIMAGSRPGDIVLDPFMGSGTVAQVAQDLGRRWIGCELSVEYAKLIAKRTAQQAMAFAPERPLAIDLRFSPLGL